MSINAIMALICLGLLCLPAIVLVIWLIRMDLAYRRQKRKEKIVQDLVKVLQQNKPYLDIIHEEMKHDGP